MKKISVTGVFAFLGLAFLLLNTLSVYASGPSEPHPGNAIWVEPSTIDLTAYTVGEKFNVTLWANVTNVISSEGKIDSWQIMLYYNTTYLNATRAGYTAGGTSELFQGYYTTPVNPEINTTAGYVMYFETIAPDGKSVPCSGSLCWIEFEVIALVPQPIEFPLNITNSDTWICDFDGYYYPPNTINQYNSTVIPEFSPSLAVAGLMILTLVAAILRKKSIRKTKLH